MFFHSAAWSPDGKLLAFAFGNSIYLTPDEGDNQHLLNTFAGVADHVRWSQGGQRILIHLRDMRSKGEMTNLMFRRINLLPDANLTKFS